MRNDTIKSAQSAIDMCWHLFLLFAVVIGASMLPEAVFAQSGGSQNNVIEQVFCNLVIILTGTTGKAVATVAIIAVGVGALLGKISWGMALIVGIGVALIFGAASIVNALGGSTSQCSSTTTIIAS
jgi:type IV secretion system protein VirB2